MLYVPFTHSPWAQVRLLVRARNSSPGTRRTIENAVWSVEPRIPLSGPFVSVRSVEDLRSARRAQERLNALLVGAFAAVAMLLAGIGMYGVISFVVTLRRREIGVRMALGAAPRRVATGMMGRALVIGLIGLVAGVLAALFLSSLISSMLYQVTPLAIERYALTAALLLGLAAGAAYLPARRASRLQPATVLKAD